jgi:hypothetical protein
MRIENRFRLPVAIALAVSVISPQCVGAAAPQLHAGAIAISGDPHGFAFISEKATTHGTVVDTFSSGDWTVKVVGTPGVAVSFQPDIVLPNGGRGFGISTMEPVAPPPNISVQDNLSDLGVRASAATTQTPAIESVTQAATPATACTGCFTDGLPHLSNNSGVCYTISLLSGTLYGTGCGFSYVDWQDPTTAGHWGLTSTYWISMTSSAYDLWGVYWRMQWPSGNQITGEAPNTSVTTSGNCGSRTFSVNLKVPTTNLGVAESYTQDLCPTLYGPWDPSGVNTSLSSGAKWVGDQPAGVTMGVQGAQSVDSPPSARVYPVNNYYLVGYGRKP